MKSKTKPLQGKKNSDISIRKTVSEKKKKRSPDVDVWLPTHSLQVSITPAKKKEIEYAYLNTLESKLAVIKVKEDLPKNPSQEVKKESQTNSFDKNDSKDHLDTLCDSIELLKRNLKNQTSISFQEDSHLWQAIFHYFFEIMTIDSIQKDKIDPRFENKPTTLLQFLSLFSAQQSSSTTKEDILLDKGERTPNTPSIEEETNPDQLKDFQRLFQECDAFLKQQEKEMTHLREKIKNMGKIEYQEEIIRTYHSHFGENILLSACLLHTIPSFSLFGIVASSFLASRLLSNLDDSFHPTITKKTEVKISYEDFSKEFTQQRLSLKDALQWMEQGEKNISDLYKELDASSFFDTPDGQLLQNDLLEMERELHYKKEEIQRFNEQLKQAQTLQDQKILALKKKQNQ